MTKCCNYDGVILQLKKTTAREEGKRKTEKMLLSWLLETSDKDMDYSQLKELVQKRARWCRRKMKTCLYGRIQHQQYYN